MLEIKITGNTADELADSMAELSKLNAVTNVGRQVLLAQQAAQQAPQTAEQSQVAQSQTLPTEDAASGPAADDNEPVDATVPAPTASVQKLLDEHGIGAQSIRGSGKDGRVTKGDVEKRIVEIAKRKSAASDEELGVEAPDEPQEPEVVDFKVPADVDEARTMLFALHKEAGQKACIDVIAGCDIKQIGELTDDKFELYGKLVADELAKAG